MEISVYIAASGKTRQAIADEAQVSRQTLHKVENRLTTTRIEVASRIAKAIGCPLDVIRPDIKDLLG